MNIKIVYCGFVQSNKGTWLDVNGNKFPWFNMICLDFCQLSFYAIYLTITDYGPSLFSQCIRSTGPVFLFDSNYTCFCTLFLPKLTLSGRSCAI